MGKESSVAENLKDAPEPEDDFFEKLLNEDIEIPKDDEDEEDDVKEADSKEKTETKDVDVEESKNDEETVESLKAKIAEMERERKGQLSDVVKSRQEKQLFKSELNQLKDAVATLLERRTNADKDVEEEEPDPLTNPRKQVEFEDDKAYVDLSEVKKAISTENAKTKAELNELREQRAIEEAQKAYVKNVRAIVSENEEVYGEAYDKLKDMFKDFNDKIIELQQRTGEMGDNGVLDQDYALDLFSGSPEEKEWYKEHPGIDPTRVVRAFNTKTDLRVGLKHLADTLKIGVKEEEPGGVLDKKIQEAKKKPGSLAGQENRAASDTSDLIERLSQMSPTEFESLSDAEAAKIEAMLLKEELKGE